MDPVKRPMPSESPWAGHAAPSPSGGHAALNVLGRASIAHASATDFFSSASVSTVCTARSTVAQSHWRKCNLAAAVCNHPAEPSFALSSTTMVKEDAFPRSRSKSTPSMSTRKYIMLGRGDALQAGLSVFPLCVATCQSRRSLL